MKTKKTVSLVLAVVLSFALCASPASAAGFSDVSSGHWAYSYIQRCSALNIVNGLPDGRFDADGHVTNAQFVKMLCVAFFDAAEQSYETANRAAIDAYFGGSAPWYGYQSYYFKEQGLLEGVTYDLRTAASANADMTRYDMAQAAANVLADRGVSATSAQKSAAQAGIGDFASIPGSYRDGVLTCYALGILTGMDGQFQGSAPMTRAQACTVITRLLDAAAGTTSQPVTQPDPVVSPEPVTTPAPSTSNVPKEITVTTKSGNNGLTGYVVTDNGFGDGYLNNGKPITEENVIELLHEAEKIWPTGIIWAESGTANNNCYYDSGSVVSLMAKRQTTGVGINLSTNYACGGFAAMISDYLFGRDNNNFHRVTDVVNGIRPGDVIFMIDTANNKVTHAMIATSASFTKVNEIDGSSHPGFVYAADGNSGGKVSWPGKYDSGTSEATSGYTWQVYSRYPQ